MKIGLIGLTVALGATLCGCLDMDMKKPWYPTVLNCPNGFIRSVITDLSQCPEGLECRVVTDPEDPSRIQYCVEANYGDGDGINCRAGYVTVPDSEKAKCGEPYDISEIDELCESGETEYCCVDGALEGRLCRKVPAEKAGSDVDIQPNQRCTKDEANPPSNTLRVHIIDVGQGDSIWIQTPTGQNVLIDGGDLGIQGKTSGGPIVTDYLNSHGFPYGSTFDALFLTHPHSDHFGGLPTIIKLYNTANYIDPMPKNWDDPASYKNWLSTITSKLDDKHIYMPASEKFNPGELMPEGFFGPDIKAEYLFSRKKFVAANGDSSNPNTASIVFRLTYGGRSFIFTGDATEVDEREIVSTGRNISSHFLKACHHGSDTSSTPEFLDAVWSTIDKSERYVFISSGRYKFSGTQIPAKSVLTRYTNMLALDHLFATSAGDDNKEESDAYRDDNILIVVRSNGSYYACYNGTN